MSDVRTDTAEYELGQDFHRVWHVRLRWLDGNRFLSACERVVADRAAGTIPGLDLERREICRRCRDVVASMDLPPF